MCASTLCPRVIGHRAHCLYIGRFRCSNHVQVRYVGRSGMARPHPCAGRSTLALDLFVYLFRFVWHYSYVRWQCSPVPFTVAPLQKTQGDGFSVGSSVPWYVLSSASPFM